MAVVLVPALLGVLGRWAFWPYGLSTGAPSGPEAGRAVVSEPLDPDGSAERPPARLIWLLSNRWVAAVAAVVVIAMLVVASRPLSGLRSAVSPGASLTAMV